MCQKTTSRLPSDGYSTGVATKGCDVVVYPDHSSLEVLDLEVLFAGWLAISIRQNVETIIWRDKDDGLV